ncbi:tape measure protein [Enterobacter cloacae complex sp. ECNIH14]|uniref:tape measure protein n=1 Tax=Enterobacter cloacae complex sp. ECNIH14 TaxID=2080664 RepID=UPI000CDDEF6C|nr:tape measure protein [Enterobacter cloacae complex sp. ECNIH14]POT89078.1 phage tail tape measure protein [Enterobacter cloacae complex sp. ECNIH14]
MASNEQVGNIVYQVQMDVAELIEAQRKVNDRLDKMGGNFDRASASVSRFEGALNKVGVAIASAITIDTAKRLIAIGDEMATLQARVTRLSPSVDAAKESMSSLSAIASETGGSLAETEKLWESLTTSLKSTGATNAQILQLTSTLQKIGTIGGSSAEEMSNALRQFGQSMSRGTIQAEEFNSIVEQMPELARQMAAGLGISTDQLRQKMLEGKLTAQDALNAIQKQTEYVNAEFEKMPVNVDRAKNSLDVAFRNAINDLNQAIGLTSTLAGLMQSVADNLNYYNNNVGDSSRMPKLIKLQQELNEEIKDGQRWYESDTIFQQRRAQAAFQLKQVEGEIAHIRAKASKDADNNQFNSPGTKGDDAATKKLVQNSERRLALAKLEGEARARLQAQYDAADAGVTDQKRIKALQDEYAETYRVTEARKESNKEGKTSASQAESIAQKLANLRAQSDLTTESIEKRRIQEAGLRAEQSLGSAATQQQLAEARALGEANEKAAISIQKRKEAEQGQKYAKQEISAGNTSVNPITGASVDPLAQINLQETQKLEAIAKYQELDKQNTQLYEDAKTAIQLQASNARMQIAQTEADQQRASVLSILGSASQGFDSLASIIADSAGKSNAAYQVMFAASKAFAIAQSTLSLNTAIMQAMADPTALTPAQKLANYAAIASAGASLLSNVASISYGGGREHGGPVSASSMYRVGEGGKPEIFKASNGSQYMIPGDNGRVISNRDMQGGGSGGSSFNPVMNLVINTTGGVGDEEIARLRKAWNNDMLKMMVDQSTRPGGLLQGRRKS